VPDADVPTVIRESIVTLGFSNTPAFKTGGRQVKARTYEVPGAGGFLLTEHAPGIERAYREGSEIAVFRDDAELADKVRHYLAHPEERDAMAVAAHERTRREHTYERRMEEVLDAAAEAIRRPRPQQEASRREASTETLAAAVRSHPPGLGLRLLRETLIKLGTVCFGEARGRRFARRATFEVSWRLAGEHTFTSRGWPGRMFPEDNG
jgi:spore maturation protein CgeB